MSVARDTLVSHCNTLLESDRFQDYCPNGLQVEGRDSIRRIAAAVTANQSVLDEAVERDVDLLLVHHGYFWRGEGHAVVGMKKRRLARLLTADLNLLAYHLPLDAHPRLGNNARLGDLLNIIDRQPLDAGNPASVGNVGTLSDPCTLSELGERIQAITQRSPQLIGSDDMPVSSVAWCTGAAQGYIDKAAACAADVYLSGEISEPTVHSARELGIAYIGAGHHATERYGVQALAEHLAETFSLEWVFIDCDNPV